MWVSDMFESCVEIRTHFSDYLDNLCTPEVLKSIRFHVAYCAACGEELAGWQSMQGYLQGLARRRVSPELAVRLRVRLSHHLHRHYLESLCVRLENLIKPLLIPATGGILTAVICFCLIIGQGVAPISNTPDVTVPIVTPPRVRTLAPVNFNTEDNPLVLAARIDAEGRVKAYRLISGQNSPELTYRLDRMIYFSRFQPATTFGMPTEGQVVLSLRRITVRG